MHEVVRAVDDVVYLSYDAVNRSQVTTSCKPVILRYTLSDYCYDRRAIRSRRRDVLYLKRKKANTRKESSPNGQVFCICQGLFL